MNSRSEHVGDGGMRSSCSFFRTRSSTKLFRGTPVNTLGSSVLGNGDVIRQAATRLENKTLIAASPWPATVTNPSLPTVATRSSLLENRAQLVTSSERPSPYQAR